MVAVISPAMQKIAPRYSTAPDTPSPMPSERHTLPDGIPKRSSAGYLGATAAQNISREPRP